MFEKKQTLVYERHELNQTPMEAILMPVPILRSFADTPEGQIHYAMAGKGKPVLLLHQTPRSWDEYRAVLPI
jgi:hypothetical protein